MSLERISVGHLLKRQWQTVSGCRPEQHKRRKVVRNQVLIASRVVFLFVNKLIIIVARNKSWQTFCSCGLVLQADSEKRPSPSLESQPL